MSEERGLTISMNITYRELSLRPDFSDIEWAKPKLNRIRLIGLHYLNVSFLGNLLSILDYIPEVTL
jgi:hypothetical protein